MQPQSLHPLLIVLNGASSSGKTSTAAALHPLLGSSCILTGLDDILERVQPFGTEQVNAIEAMLRRLKFQLTDGRLKLFRRLHREVVEWHQAGHDVIVDTALMDRRALLDAAHCFAPLQGFFIGMKPPLPVSEAWELKRSDRPPGQARKHYDLIHTHNTYDLLLDPSNFTPQECASLILQHCQTTTPTAFQQLAQQKR